MRAKLINILSYPEIAYGNKTTRVCLHRIINVHVIL